MPRGKIWASTSLGQEASCLTFFDSSSIGVGDWSQSTIILPEFSSLSDCSSTNIRSELISKYLITMAITFTHRSAIPAQRMKKRRPNATGLLNRTGSFLASISKVVLQLAPLLCISPLPSSSFLLHHIPQPFLKPYVSMIQIGSSV